MVSCLCSGHKLPVQNDHSSVLQQAGTHQFGGGNGTHHLLRCQTEKTQLEAVSWPQGISQTLHATVPVLTQISSFQLHLEHLTVSSALVQRYNSQGELSASNSKEAVQTVALGWEENISKPC